MNKNPTSWQKIREAAKAGRPLFLYGMGNGAEKIVDILTGMGVTVSGVFASDDFVRGQSFKGFLVQKYSEIKDLDPVIIVCFGTAIPEIIARIADMAKIHTVIMPDVPVTGERLFDEDFYFENEYEIEAVRDLFSDDFSRTLFENFISFKLTGDIKYLLSHTTDFADIFKSASPSDEENYADCGAYTGDTVKIFTEVTNGKYNRIDAFEPSAKTFKKLQKNTVDIHDIILHNAAVWNDDSEAFIDGTDNKNSNLFGRGSYAINTVQLSTVCPDATLIKLDVEGAEREALQGIDLTKRQKLIVALYHRSEDFFKIPLYLQNFGYSFKLRRINCLPAWDLFLVASR
jgi:FkbM family methyltransferase